MRTKKNTKLSSEEQKYTSRGIILGIFLAILCNCIYLTTNILVKQYKLLAAEICFIRGLLQISAFFIVYITVDFCRKYLQTNMDIDQETNNVVGHSGRRNLINLDWKLAIVTSLCGISFGSMTLLAYIGVKLIPLSDFVVFGHTAPVFTLILSALILR